MFGWITAIAIAAGLSLMLMNAERRLNNSQEKVGRQKAEISQLETDIKGVIIANKRVRETLDLCKVVNRENVDARDAAMLMAIIAAGESDILRDELEDMINATSIEVTDTECRTMADPFPASYVSQLCVESGSNCRRN